MAYIDKYGVKYSDDKKTLIWCPKDFKGDYCIEEGVTSIGKGAFFYCSSLTSVTIPNSVTSINLCAFYGCASLSSITIPNSVISIGDEAFCECVCLTSVTIPNSVTSIGEYAFYRCFSLTDITIPNSVTSIGNRAFDGCTSLPIINNIRYADTYLVEAVGEPLTSNIVIDGTRWIGDDAFSGCVSLVSIKIPDSVTSIGNYAFKGCSGLNSITIPNSVTIIGNGAFKDCINLTQITIPNSITSIGSQTFSNCKCLSSITIPDSVTSIGSWAFEGCASLSEVTMSNNLINIGTGIFINCESLPVYDGIRYADTYLVAAVDKTLTSLMVKEGTRWIGDGAFSGCSNLVSIRIPDSVMSIGKFAFKGCTGLTSPIDNAHVFAYMPRSYSGAYAIQDGIESIVDGACKGCLGLTSITVPNSVTYIGDEAFKDCSNLRSIAIGGNTYINLLAFGFEGGPYPSERQSNLKEIHFSGSIEEWCLKKWETPYLVNNTTYDLYIQETKLVDLVIPDGITCIDNYAFYGCKSLRSVVISDSVTSVGEFAFEGCTGLTSPVYNAHVFAYMPRSYSGAYAIPNGIKCIADGAFSGCSGLTNIIIPNSVTIIGNGAFEDCSIKEIYFSGSIEEWCLKKWWTRDFDYDLYIQGTKVVDLVIPDSVTSIGYSSFYGCKSLRSVVISDSVTSVGEFAFEGCTGLTSPVYNAHVFAYMPRSYSGTYAIPNGIKCIAGGAFDGCSGLTNIIIPNSVEYIGDYAFKGCSGLNSITIPNNVKKFGEEIFGDCPSVMELHFSGTIEEWCARSWAGISSAYDLYIQETKLIDLVIPDGITRIDSHAFYGCKSLRSVVITDSVISIGEDAFKGCTGLASPVYNAHVFAYMPRSYSGTYAIPNGIKCIADGAFSGCSGLTNIIIPDSVKSIGEYAFRDCSGMVSITIPYSVTSIGKRAFDGCKKIEIIKPITLHNLTANNILHFEDMVKVVAAHPYPWLYQSGYYCKGNKDYIQAPYFANLGELHQTLNVYVVDSLQPRTNNIYIYNVRARISSIKDEIEKLKTKDTEGKKITYLKGLLKKLEQVSIDNNGGGIITTTIQLAGQYNRNEKTGKGEIWIVYTPSAEKMVLTYLHEMMHAYYDASMLRQPDIEYAEEPLAELGKLRFCEDFDKDTTHPFFLYNLARKNVEDKQFAIGIGHYGFGLFLMDNYHDDPWENILRSHHHLLKHNNLYQELESSLGIYPYDEENARHLAELLLKYIN